MTTFPQQINLENSESWADKDVDTLRQAFPFVECIEDCIELWQTNAIVRIADAKDYEYLYQDFVWDNPVDIDYENFIAEYKKGYGISEYIEIARLIELSNGIWYDAEYC